MVLLSFLLGSIDVFKGLLLKIIIDTSVGNLSYSFKLVFIIIGLFIIFDFISNFFFQKILYSINTSVIYDIKNDILKTLLYNEENKINQDNNMDILSLLNKDIEIIFNKYFLNIFLFTKILISLLMSLAYMLYVSVGLTFIVLFLGSINMIIPHFFVKKSGKLKEIYSQSNGTFFNSIKELLYGINTIKLYGIENLYLEKNIKTNANIEKARLNTILFDALIQIVCSSAGFLALASNVVIAGYLSYKGYFTIGTVLAVMQVMNYVLFPLSQAPMYYAEIKSVKYIVTKVKNYIGNYDNKCEYIFDEHIDNILLSNVFFQYPNSTKNVLSNININFKNKNKYAIIGTSGCGKTTLINLLAKLETTSTGNITVNNINFNIINPKIWRKKIAVISQDIFIFNDTLKYNICLNNQISDDKLANIIEKVGLAGLVDTLPKGVDSPLGENGNLLSGGEKQRISIARALAKNAEILLVDEATSSLDKENTNNIDSIIFSLDKLVIVVTHKYEEELLKNYDCILVMENGFIVESGNYNDLISEKNKLYDLLNFIPKFTLKN